jgi:ABC-2 type transport system ATP-binding protein
LSIIECTEVSKVYGSFSAVDKLTCTIEENSITGLIGRNGAGKTTLLRMINGFTKNTSGEIKVFEESPFNSLKVSSNTIFIDDNMYFPKNFTLEEIINSGKSFYHELDEEFCIKLMEYFNLNRNKKHSQLSKGMKSSFNMILGIASRCPLTIMDEPTTGMDAAVRKDFYRIILRDYIDHPRTIIISSHLLNELDEILENILLIKEGNLCIHMPLVDLKEYAIGYLGSTESVNKLSTGREVIYEEAFGKDNIYQVVKTIDFQGEQAVAKLNGVEAKTVSSNDLCIYLTEHRKGGISNVFSKK